MMPPPPAPADAAVFALWQAWAFLRHPRRMLRYRREAGRWPDVARPALLSERMLWRKLFDRNPLFVTFADKLATKDWIAARCPGLAIPRTLWRGTDPAAIPPSLLRPGVVIKANHGSGFNLFLRESVPPRAEVEALARRWLATGFGRSRGEWHYTRVRREIFVEELLGRPETPLFDITVRAGGGRVAYGTVLLHAKTPAERSSAFDPEGRPIHQPNRKRSPPLPPGTPLPAAYARAVEAARLLSREVDFARFDFLACGEELYAGEITLFPGSGMHDPQEPALSLVLRAWDMRNSWFLQEGAAAGGWLARRYAAAFARSIAAERAARGWD
ncbi:MAG: hypothetical protein N2Z67_08285 [Acetobacteraceae bacterium]|nr:hypothetical protein [Acetobacteraceae bacterium]